MPPDCANYNNPSVAYGSTLVPCSVGDDGHCPPETPQAMFGKSGYYQPRHDNALILFGCLPPETQYFGIRSYLYEKGKANVPPDLDCSDAMSSPSGEEVQVFPPEATVQETRVVIDSPWYDTTNHLNINAVGRPGSKTKFRSLFVHITSANKQVAEDIILAFAASGVPLEAINVDSIPDLPVFHLEGDSSARDSFRTIYRLVLPESFVSNPEQPSPVHAVDIDKYIANGNRNILVRYLSPKSPVPKDGFPPQLPTPRATGTSESNLVGEGTFQRLLSAVKLQHGEPDYVSQPIPIVINMRKCLLGCYGFGDNEDTVYINTDKEISIAGPDDLAVVCGANHVLLEYAVYSSVGIYNTSGLAVGLVTDEMKLNSAVRYAPSLPHVERFYCVEIRPSCNGRPFCVQPIFEGTDTVLVQFRVNLNPRTKTGPATEELIWPMIMGYLGSSKK